MFWLIHGQLQPVKTGGWGVGVFSGGVVFGFVFLIFLLQHECFFRRFHRSLVKLLNGLGCLDWQRHCHSWTLASHRLKQQYCFQSGEKIQYEVWNRFLYHTFVLEAYFAWFSLHASSSVGQYHPELSVGKIVRLSQASPHIYLGYENFFLWSGFFSRRSMMCLSWEGIFCLFNQG